MSDAPPLKVLILCTGNSARSILAEYLLRKIGGRRFESFSAGSDPKGQVHPLAVQVLRDVYQIDASDARSKSWEEFRGVDFDFVITVCDNARDSCPLWPGRTVVLHWGMDDPAAVEGTDEEKLQAFEEAARILRGRLLAWVETPQKL